MLSLTVHNLEEVTVFRCAGRITADDGHALQNAFLSQPHLQIAILDLAEISAVDAGGLGLLMSLRIWTMATGKELRLMNLTPRVEELLELTNLRHLFAVCSLHDMLDLFCRTTHQSRFAAASQATEIAPLTGCTTPASFQGGDSPPHDPFGSRQQG